MPFWLDRAKRYVGEAEVKGAVHNPVILGWWSKIKAKFRDDETPWCAAFVGGVLEECGIKSTRSAAARSYTRWGVKLAGPAVGAIVVFWRNSPTAAAGHVGFVVGRDLWNNLLVLGGNQGDAVTIKPFAIERVLSYHWPDNVSLPPIVGLARLPLERLQAALSENEA